MKARTVSRIEFGVEAVAAASMAAALGYAVTVLVTGLYPFPVVPGMAAAAIAFTSIREALKRLAPPVAGRGRQQPAPAFALKLSDFLEVGAPVAGQNAMTGGEPLPLDEVIAELGPDAPVVRLFDRDTRPKPEELAARIEQDFGGRTDDLGEAATAPGATNRQSSAPRG